METFTTLKTLALDMTANPDSTNTTIINQMVRFLNARYRLVKAEMPNYTNQALITATTEADEQYYAYPSLISKVHGMTVTSGTMAYILDHVSSLAEWQDLNEVEVGGIPQRYFARDRDFGIWPIPEDDYTISLTVTKRDTDLQNDDYTTGTVTATNDSTTITGSGTTFTAAMVGRYFKVNATGVWYRIAGFTNTTTIALEQSYQEATVAGAAYTIGEAPDLPAEGHILLAQGAAADWYGSVRKDRDMSNFYNNMFWTGDGSNPYRNPSNIRSGLIGMRKRYALRSNNRNIQKRRSTRISPADYIWGESITP